MMKEYLLVAKGNEENWAQKPDADRNKVENDFALWISGMKEKNLWIRGDKLSTKRKDIERSDKNFQVIDGPFTETKELTGYFLFKAENMDHAAELAKGCPALLHDSLSLYEMEGDR